jgi:hypothetical protein
VRLFEHPDFDQAVLRATEHFQSRGLRPAIIEKDYYVTEALRIIATTVGDMIRENGACWRHCKADKRKTLEAYIKRTYRCIGRRNSSVV